MADNVNNNHRPRYSAYAYFYKDERIKIIAALNCENETERLEMDPEISNEMAENYKEKGESFIFKELTSIIARRWGRLSDERRAPYVSLAERDRALLVRDR